MLSEHRMIDRLSGLMHDLEASLILRGCDLERVTEGFGCDPRRAASGSEQARGARDAKARAMQAFVGLDGLGRLKLLFGEARRIGNHEIVASAAAFARIEKLERVRDQELVLFGIEPVEAKVLAGC